VFSGIHHPMLLAPPTSDQRIGNMSALFIPKIGIASDSPVVQPVGLRNLLVS
jgi:hypothetical protein